jgi:hypothetical protein
MALRYPMEIEWGRRRRGRGFDNMDLSAAAERSIERLRRRGTVRAGANAM